MEISREPYKFEIKSCFILGGEKRERGKQQKCEYIRHLHGPGPTRDPRWQASGEEIYTPEYRVSPIYARRCTAPTPAQEKTGPGSNKSSQAYMLLLEKMNFFARLSIPRHGINTGFVYRGIRKATEYIIYRPTERIKFGEPNLYFFSL